MRLKRGGDLSAGALAADCGLSVEQVTAGLTICHEMSLVRFSMVPWSVRMLPMVKGGPENSAVWRYLQMIRTRVVP